MEMSEDTIIFNALSTSNKKVDFNDMIFLDKNLFSFSPYYKSFLSNNMFMRYLPILHNFTYIKEVELYLDNVYIVYGKKDLIQGMFTKEGGINMEVINKKKKRTYYGCIVFAPLMTSKYPIYFPQFLFNDVNKCVKKVLISMKQYPKERTWVSREVCNQLPLKKCVLSDTCTWNVTECLTHSEFVRKSLSELNMVMKPYKYYMFTEFQINMKHLTYDIYNGLISKKPPGIWFAVGDEWLQHMKKTNFWMNKYNYLYEIELYKDNIIVIDSMKKLQEFSSKYGVKKDTKVEFQGVQYTLSLTSDVDWYKVKKETKTNGVIISPNFKKIYYKYSKHNHLFNVFDGLEWYMSWDIASGVLWDTKEIKGLNLVYEKSPGHFIQYPLKKLHHKDSLSSKI